MNEAFIASERMHVMVKITETFTSNYLCFEQNMYVNYRKVGSWSHSNT